MATSDQYLQLLRNLLPPGAAWPREDDSDLTKLLGAMADELATIHNRAEALIEEADPRTTLELLPDWERMLGLPDGCTELADTLQERRQAVVSRLTLLGGQSIAYFTAVALSLGYEDIAIEEFRPSVCGIAMCGYPLGGTHSIRHYWRVVVPGPRLTYARCGVSQCGDLLLNIDRADDLECLLGRLKPAQSNLIFSYEGV